MDKPVHQPGQAEVTSAAGVTDDSRQPGAAGVTRAASTPAHDVVIQLQHVSKTYTSGEAAVPALEDVSLDVRQDTFVSLIGPSGCGKSTILKLVTGVSQPTGGVIAIRGQPADGINTQIGYVTQDHNLFPWMTLQENVEFPLLARGVPPEERRRRVAELIELVGLAGFERAYPHELSGGMQKRGAIVRTLVYDPDVIVMDEPFGPLDAHTRLLMQQELLDLWAHKRKTILFVTHDLNEAIALSDHVVLMTRRPGRIKAVFDTLLPRPRDVFTIHENTEFHDFYRQIWHAFRDEIHAQRREGR